ncbi:toxin-antitoxin system YwqK family antitoxin [Verrucomicrobia bacterium]|nr:toxin-antitoxin system YwqK family antitoxin [Verrucomicrobiota bacterium]
MVKAILFALFATLLMTGCGGLDLDDKDTRDRIIAEAIEEGKLRLRWKQRELLHYAPEQQMPYSGWTKSFYDNGQIKALTRHQHGKKDGLSIKWHENGQKSFTARFREDKPVDFWIKWYENGQKEREVNFKDGKQDGLWTSWYENGQKEREMNFKVGKLMSVEAWRPNAEKCPVTNLVNGNGVWVWYFNDGSEKSRHNIKDGEFIKN